MKTPKNYILTIFAMCMVLLAFADGGKLKTADRLYNELSYADAIMAYQELVAFGDTSEHVTRRLANCYRFINDPVQAEHWYANLLEITTKNADDFYYYAEALAENGKYEQANFWLAEYYDKKTTDTRGWYHFSGMERINRLKGDSTRFKVSTIDANSDLADFAPSFMGKDVMFVSARGNTGSSIKRSHTWDNKGFLDLYIAGNSTPGILADPSPLKGDINTPLHEGPATYNADKDIIVFTRNSDFKSKVSKSEDGVTNLKMFFAKKDDKGKWSDIEPFPFNNDEYSVGHPSMAPDGKKLYFVSDMPGSLGNSDIWVTERAEDGTWISPVNAGYQINTEGNEMFPFIHANGNLFFASDGHLGLGGLDVFMVEAKEDGFGHCYNLGCSVNGRSDDFAFILDENEKFGYFSSNREGGIGDDDIYAVEMFNAFIRTYTITGTITQLNQIGTPIENARIDLIDDEGVIFSRAKADKDGNFRLYGLPGKDYVIETYKENYRTITKSVSTKDLPEDQRFIYTNLVVPSTLDYTISTKIIDSETNESIEGAVITLTNNADETESYELKEIDYGMYMTELPNIKEGKPVSFKVLMAKEGYLSESFDMELTPSDSKMLTFNGIVLKLSPISDGVNLTELLSLKPIYFGLDEHDISSEAAVELDKIVEVMKDNPTLEIEMGSHADSRGSKSYNDKLSKKRAKASVDYITERGIDPSRISGKGYGESELKNSCEDGVECSDAKHQENRRTEARIVKI